MLFNQEVSFGRRTRTVVVGTLVAVFALIGLFTSTNSAEAKFGDYYGVECRSPVLWEKIWSNPLKRSDPMRWSAKIRSTRKGLTFRWVKMNKTGYNGGIPRLFHSNHWPRGNVKPARVVRAMVEYKAYGLFKEYNGLVITQSKTGGISIRGGYISLLDKSVCANVSKNGDDNGTFDPRLYKIKQR